MGRLPAGREELLIHTTAQSACQESPWRRCCSAARGEHFPSTAPIVPFQELSSHFALEFEPKRFFSLFFFLKESAFLSHVFSCRLFRRENMLSTYILMCICGLQHVTLHSVCSAYCVLETWDILFTIFVQTFNNLTCLIKQYANMVPPYLFRVYKIYKR